jgi:hypothetical protein
MSFLLFPLKKEDAFELSNPEIEEAFFFKFDPIFLMELTVYLRKP